MNKKRFFSLLSVVCLMCLSALANDNLQMMKLQAEMLRLISTPDKDQFMEVTEQLKKLAQEQGDERVFYTAWGNQSTYEAAHQNYMKADEIASQIGDYAEDQNSYWGHYIALHSKAVNALQKQDYQTAEDTFLKAVEFRHKYFPNESATTCRN